MGWRNKARKAARTKNAHIIRNSRRRKKETVAKRQAGLSLGQIYHRQALLQR